MTYVIAQPCVDLKDRACVDECPVDCIYEGKRMLYIHPDECVDCGACEPVCPVEAIFYEDDTPEQWKELLRRQRGLLRRPRLARWRRQDGRDRQGPPAHRGAAAAEPGRLSDLRVERTRARLRAAPDFPWDQLTTYAAPGARPPRRHRRPVGRHAGRPDARGRAAGAARRPRTRRATRSTIGREDTRQACIDWLARRYGVTGLGLDGVLPVIGSKELIGCAGRAPRASAPATWSVFPALAYPTYEVGAALAGAEALATDALTALGPRTPRAAVAQLAVQPDRPGAAARAPAQGRRLVPRARHDAGLRRVLPRVRLGGRARSRCCTPTSAAARTRASSPVHSLSKRSNLAGYRCAFVAGDPALVGRAARGPQEPRPADARPAAGAR